jgi:hypothetical protein
VCEFHSKLLVLGRCGQRLRSDPQFVILHTGPRVFWDPVNMLWHNEHGQHCCAAEAASRVIKYFGRGKIRLKQEFAARKLHANLF